MIIKKEISSKLKEFHSLCKNHNVRYLYAFGSSVCNEFNAEQSDIDLLVDIDLTDPIERGEKLISLWDQLESFFQRKVDLLTESSIQNPYLKKSINKTKVKLYDGRGEKVLI